MIITSNGCSIARLTIFYTTPPTRRQVASKLCSTPWTESVWRTTDIASDTPRHDVEQMFESAHDRP
jgi:hypothetical protein